MTERYPDMRVSNVEHITTPGLYRITTESLKGPLFQRTVITMMFLTYASKPQRTEESVCERMKEIANKAKIYQQMHNIAMFIL